MDPKLCAMHDDLGQSSPEETAGAYNRLRHSRLCTPPSWRPSIAIVHPQGKRPRPPGQGGGRADRHIDLQFTDVIGGVKTVTIPASQLGDAIAHGTWFDGSSVDSFARTAESDMYLIPDPSTFQLLPWGDERTARLICWATTPDGEPTKATRGACSGAPSRAERLGFEYRVGPEVEFFLLERNADGTFAPTRNDRSSYFDFSSDGNRDLRQRMVSALMSLGIAVNTSHHEIAGGQHEIDIDAAPALKAADDLITFRYALKAVAEQSGVIATFMPKPFDGKPGSGMHVHQSLVRVRDATNAFAGDDAYGLSDVAQHFIAGQLHHAAGISAVLAPLVNSYKRLVRGFEAPIFIPGRGPIRER